MRTGRWYSQLPQSCTSELAAHKAVAQSLPPGRTTFLTPEREFLGKVQFAGRYLEFNVVVVQILLNQLELRTRTFSFAIILSHLYNVTHPSLSPKSNEAADNSTP